MNDYFSKHKTGGQINSKIANQDSLASIYAIQQLMTPDIFSFNIKIDKFSIHCESDDDICIVSLDNKIFIQVKSYAITPKDFYEIMDAFLDAFLEEREDGRNNFFVLSVFENFKIEGKKISDSLKSYRNILRNPNETDQKKQKVKNELIQNFKLEKYEEIIDYFTIDERPLLRHHNDTLAIFSMYLRLVYGFKNQKEEYIHQVFDKLANKMAELRATRNYIDRTQIEELIGSVLVKDTIFDNISVLVGYKKKESGYIIDEQMVELQNKFYKAYNKVTKSILSGWRKVYFRKFLKSQILGPDRCPECGHPMIANFWGSGKRGIACPNCGFSPYYSIFIICEECESYRILKSQPEIEDDKLFGYLVDFYNSFGGICDKCGKNLFDQHFQLRVIFLPVPYPFDKINNITEIYKNSIY